VTETIEVGYLDDDYLESPYASGTNSFSWGAQVNMVFKDQLKASPSQVDMSIDTDLSLAMQTLQVIRSEKATGSQARMELAGIESSRRSQVDMSLDDSNGYRMEVIMDSLRHATREFYLVGGYLEEPYLATGMWAFLPSQVRMSVSTSTEYGTQVDQVIDASTSRSSQVKQVISVETPRGMQANMVKTVRYGSQATMILYNTSQLRILLDFPSRGINGENWTSSPASAAGDFSPFNLNTDIVEQVFRSSTGGSLLTTLTCDTGVPQGVVVDTIGVLNHNLTRAAQVQVQASQSGAFGPPDLTFDLVVEDRNLYWIAPELPKNSFRYWRFVIQDPSNPNPYVQIGTIVFGSSRIFSKKTAWNNPLQRGLRHFKDVIATEGFTNVQNDRALRAFLRLSFTEMNYAKGDVRLLQEVMESARTSLKALWVPDPRIASRFAIFAKLVTLPEFTHQSIGEQEEYVGLDLELDESL